MVFHLRSACYSGPEKAVKSWKGPYGSLTLLHLHQNHLSVKQLSSFCLNTSVTGNLLPDYLVCVLSHFSRVRLFATL